VQFRWNDWNIEHVLKHGISLNEAEDVVRQSARPFPRYLEDGKWLVWGRGQGGRFVQVIFVLDDTADIYVIHARLLTEREKRAYRKRMGGS
jgi:uncharacterized DUF497 family protein